MIDLINVDKRYFESTENELMALNHLNLHVDEGEFIAIVGESGSGKSTLVNIIGALDRPSDGEYILDGIPLQSMNSRQLADIRNQKIGFVFQTFNLLGRSNAQKNVELPMLYAGLSKSERKNRARELLKMVNMENRARHRPNELSGGQKQRVAIARALANDPAILLADEPTGALDSKTGNMVMDIFLRIHEEGHKTVLLITHSQELAQRCPRVVTLLDGEIVSDTREGRG